MSQFRSHSLELMRQWIEAHCGGEDPTEPMRALVDAIQVGVGTELLRELPRARAYHTRSGALESGELLMAGQVISMIRDRTGMASEPGQPIQRPARRGLVERIRSG